MGEIADLRQGVTPAVHRVLDCLENLADGPLGRVTVVDLLAEIDLIGETVFTRAGLLVRPVDVASEAGRHNAAVAAMCGDSAVRMAALLLLAIERAASVQAFADSLPEKAAK